MVEVKAITTVNDLLNRIEEGNELARKELLEHIANSLKRARVAGYEDGLKQVDD
jgi:hypothetical protein